MLIKSDDGPGLADEEIEVKLERDGVTLYTNTFSSNSEGYLEFTFNPTSIVSTDIFSTPGTIYLRVNFLNLLFYSMFRIGQYSFDSEIIRLLKSKLNQVQMLKEPMQWNEIFP